MGPDAPFKTGSKMRTASVSAARSFKSIIFKGSYFFKGDIPGLWLVCWEGTIKKTHDIKIHHDFFKMIGTSEPKSWIFRPLSPHLFPHVSLPCKNAKAKPKKNPPGLGRNLRTRGTDFLSAWESQEKTSLLCGGTWEFWYMSGQFPTTKPAE